MVPRPQYRKRIKRALARNPVVALIGPRQCGKTTIAREFLEEGESGYFDMEDPFVAEAMEDPMATLSPLEGLIVIDEAQRRPELFPVLRVLADRKSSKARFLILGSASPELSRQSAESLAGRIEIIEMAGFDLAEVSTNEQHRLWLRGGLPRSFLADEEGDSYEWRRQFIRTFVERDIAQLGFRISPTAIGRFWRMLSHYHGQIFNGSEIASALGVSPQTAHNYLNALEQTYMVRRLEPWFVNVGKRLVKSPKVYLCDSGLFHTLQGIRNHEELVACPKLGASWEGFALEQILRQLPGEDAYFYAVHNGSELDLYLPQHHVGFEIKRKDAPRRSRSMSIAKKDLQLKQLYVVYPGERRHSLADGIEAVPLSTNIASLL
ncbi:ATP-binding protein [Puniceicoccales bacterium CK1056]|uniref:ATP-binding protein n=1 Tax=Oceanipulchritudo coccoides TaxID=2706888 RepID=A0A6B2M1L3_9BACT|nr:ATP-binding protein [Oceanipulchritudo coccoides]NDV61675.1 ATP-binding protein [Oceanipulchritudo coccoides]